MNLTPEEKEIFCEVADIFEIPDGAYNFRVNGKSVSRQSSEHINITSRRGGLKITIDPDTKGETVHIPVAISVTGLKETVYNDFYIGENADVTIIAGCGIYNCGGQDAVHDGVHRFYVEKNAKVKYIEKHFGFGPGRGGKLLNPRTIFYLDEGAEAEAVMEQIKGVDSTKRDTRAILRDNAKFVVKERLMTHGRQTAKSSYKVSLDGQDSTADVVSRSVAQDLSLQKFSAKIIGNNKCRGHLECDAIIMDEAKVTATPTLEANTLEAKLVHEAAIGKIAGAEITKLMSLGLTKKEAESHIINGFLK